MPKKPEAVVNPSMEDIFQAMKHCEQTYGVQLGLVIFPVQDSSFGANFGLAVKVYGPDRRCIREVSCHNTYWPSNKYVCWEAAALDCVYATEKELGETYFPLLNYLAGYKS